MAHFAQLDDDNQVIQVIVVSSSDTTDKNGQEVEAVGIRFCQSLLGGRWVQTSYNGNFRKHYAGIGFTYDLARDAFIPPKPFPSWILDEDTCLWQPPFPRPDDGLQYKWDETTLSWIVVPEQTVD